MSETKVFEASEVSQHSVEKDCWIILGNEEKKVYDVTKYLQDHPGGPEIILEFGGKDADHMFEDIGHSTEARKKMKEYEIGSLKFDPDAPQIKSKTKKAVESKGGLNPIAVLAILLAIVIGIYFSQQK